VEAHAENQKKAVVGPGHPGAGGPAAWRLRPAPGVQKVSLVPVEAAAPTATPASASAPLRVAVAAVISPQGTLPSYDRLLACLGKALGRPVELVQRRTYAETNDLLRTRQVDLAFVCTGAYVRGQREFGMELLVAPQVNSETVYYSYIIVPADSPAQSLVQSLKQP